MLMINKITLYGQKQLIKYFGKKNENLKLFSFLFIFLFSLTIGASFLHFFQSTPVVDSKFIRNEFINMIKEKAKQEPNMNYFNLFSKIYFII
jgi:hypothetical protein